MLVEVDRLLVAHAGELHNPPGAVRTHVRTRAVGDWIRRRRIEMGAQARVDRIRSAARARGLPDEFHRALMEYLVDEAGSPAPLEGQESLVRRLAVRCAAEFGGTPEQYRARIITVVAVVEQHCRSGPRVNDGTAQEPDYVTWWERYVERPLGRRPRQSDLTIPDEALAGPTAPENLKPDLCDPVSAWTCTGSDGLAVATLVEAVRRKPDEPAVALREGLRELVERGLLTHRTVTALLGDRDRFATATHELSALACVPPS